MIQTSMRLNFSLMYGLVRWIAGGSGAGALLDARVLQREQLLLESDTKVYEP